MNNPDIYDSICHLTDHFNEKYKNAIPSLEEYLRSLWSIVSQSRDLPLALENIVAWLERAFTEEPPPFDPAWMLRPKTECHEPDSFEGWENIILYQIADLRRMGELGMLDDEYRYMGLTSPSGLSWYNFDPLTYLGCGMSGPWYRNERLMPAYVPENDQIDSGTGEKREISWRDFYAILYMGRIYE